MRIFRATVLVIICVSAISWIVIVLNLKRQSFGQLRKITMPFFTKDFNLTDFNIPDFRENETNKGKTIFAVLT